MSSWEQRIVEAEKAHGDSRVAAFKKRRRFRRRAEKLGFHYAYNFDSGATSEVIRLIRHAIYCSEQCAEYGLTLDEKKNYFDLYVRDDLPTRYEFLSFYGWEIADLPF